MTKALAIGIAAALLAACAGLDQSGGTPTTGAQPTGYQTRFGSPAACEPANWVWVGERAKRLPPAQRQQVENLLWDAQGYHTDGDYGHCLFTLQKAEQIVVQGAPASGS